MALIGIVCGLAMLTAAAQGSSNVEDSQGEQSALQSDATPLNGADNRHNPYDCWPKEEIDRAIALDESYLNYLNNFAAGDQSQMIAHYRRDLASLQSAKTDVECAKKNKCVEKEYLISYLRHHMYYHNQSHQNKADCFQDRTAQDRGPETGL